MSKLISDPTDITVSSGTGGASGDTVFETNSVERLRLTFDGESQFSSQIARDDFNLAFGDSGSFLHLRRHVSVPSGVQTNAEVYVQAHGTKSVSDRAAGQLVIIEDDSFVASTPPTITNCVDNGSGLVRITCVSHGFSTNDWIAVYAVDGTTESNGAWQITVIDPDTFDLQGSTFTHTYTSGGAATNRPMMTGSAVSVIPTQGRGGLSGTAADADDVNAFVAYNGSTNNANATTAYYVGDNPFTSDTDQWYSAFQTESAQTIGLNFQQARCSEYGIDLRGSGPSPSTYGFAGLRLPNNVVVVAANHADTGNVQMFKVDTSDELEILPTTRFAGQLVVQDGVNITFGASSGNKIGTTTSQKLGFFGVTPVVQPATAGATTGFAANAGTAMNSASTSTGGIGTKAYTFGDVVLALKTLGLVAA